MYEVKKGGNELLSKPVKKIINEPWPCIRLTQAIETRRQSVVGGNSLKDDDAGEKASQCCQQFQQ